MLAIASLGSGVPQHKEVNMTMQGDGESQPGESAEPTLDSMAGMLDSEEGEALEESEGEESEESEVEQPEEGDEGEEAAEEPTFTIKVDGKDVVLTQSEALAMAQQGKDYSNKTMALAEERKAVEAEKAQAAEIRTRHAGVLDESIGRLEAFRGYLQTQLGDPPSVEMIQTYGADYYLAQKEQHEQRKGQLQEAQAGIEHLSNERQRQRQAYLKDTASASIAALKDTLPGWSDETLPELEKYVHSLGLTPDAMEAGYVQKNLWLLAHKAKAYDALQATKAAMKPVSTLPKVIRPGSSNQPQHLAKRQEAMKRHERAPSISTLADLL